MILSTWKNLKYSNLKYKTFGLKKQKMHFHFKFSCKKVTSKRHFSLSCENKEILLMEIIHENVYFIENTLIIINVCEVWFN